MKKFARDDAEAAEKASTRVERMLECELMILTIWAPKCSRR